MATTGISESCSFFQCKHAGISAVNSFRIQGKGDQVIRIPDLHPESRKHLFRGLGASPVSSGRARIRAALYRLPLKIDIITSMLCIQAAGKRKV